MDMNQEQKSRMQLSKLLNTICSHENKSKEEVLAEVCHDATTEEERIARLREYKENNGIKGTRKKAETTIDKKDVEGKQIDAVKIYNALKSNKTAEEKIKAIEKFLKEAIYSEKINEIKGQINKNKKNTEELEKELNTYLNKKL